MKEEDKKYIEATNRWIKSQVILIEQLEISAKYSADMMASHQKRFDLDRESILIEEKSLLEVIENTKEYCRENGISEDVLIKV